MQIPSGNWLISGGCGFIGLSLLSKIMEHGNSANVRILDNLSVGSKRDLAEVVPFRMVAPNEITNSPQGIELVEGDIRNAADCLSAAYGVDTIIHLAANTGVGPSVENPRLDMESNVLGIFNMLEAAREHGAKNFVFASSGAPLGDCVPPVHEDMPPRPMSPYGASKLAGEAYCSAFARTFGIKTVALRFSNVYGPLSKQKSSVVAKFFKLGLAGKPLRVYGDGGQTRDFIFIDDLINAILLSVHNGKRGEIYQIATQREMTVNDIAQMVSEILREKEGIEVEVFHESSRLGDMPRNYADISKARRELNFCPVTDLRAGLERTYAYFKKLSISQDSE